MKHYSAGKLLSNDVVEVVEMMRDSDFGTWFTPPRKKQIAWVEETESNCELWYKHSFIKDYVSYSDYYGYDTSRKESIKDAKKLVDVMAIERDSGLVVKVKQKVEHIPMILVEEIQPGKKVIGNIIGFDGPRLFMNNPTLLRELTTLMENKIDNVYDRMVEICKEIELKQKTVAENKVVWNSLKGDIE